jgi:hypothetical protein
MRWAGAAGFGLLLASSAPADATTSVRLADGAVLTVDEVAGPGSSAAARRSRSLVFTLESSTGTLRGTVPPTGDGGVDASPLLAIDPRSGGPVLVWSRHDGAGGLKLAWTRFESGTWGAMRHLTFGRGDDRSPAVGTSNAGTYLFWRGASGEVFQAPIDLATGRLFGAPRALPIGSYSPQGGSDVPVGITPGEPSTNGGTDVPIGIILPPDDPPRPNGGSDAPIIICTGNGCPPQGDSQAPVDDDPSPTGGSDVPIIGTNSFSTSSPGLFVVSEPSCGAQLVLVGSPSGRTLLAVQFTGSGRVSVLGRMTIPPGVTTTDAATAAGARFLEAVCR